MCNLFGKCKYVCKNLLLSIFVVFMVIYNI